MAQTTQSNMTFLAEHPLLHNLVDHWWLFLVRGISAIIFGVVAFAWPGVTLFTLMLFFGLYALADGALNLFLAFTGRTSGSRWWLALAGIAGIGAGVAVFAWPGLTTVALLLLIAVWAIATGALQVAGGILLRKDIEHEWLFVAGGAVSVLFGLFMLAQPGAGAVALLYLIGAYAIFYGLMLVLFSFRLKRIG